MLEESIVDGLNPEQRAAVECTEGPLLVLAGAGSGKTRVLTRRIAYLIGHCGIAPESILAVTFTNKAAGEMRERVEKSLDVRAEGLWIGTFHSTCVRILRRDIGHLGRSRGFVIYDDTDSLGVVKEAIRRHGLDPKVVDPKRVRWRIDQWKNQGYLPAKAREEAEDIDDEQTAELYASYQRLLADANALDFGDLLVQTVELFTRFPEVLAHYQRRWQYVLVDEYQDTNGVQYELVRLLAEQHRNLCVVGDPDQSIYAWRGADIRNILDFEHDYEDAKVVKLEHNYRSTQPILSGASAVVRKNPGRREKEMRTTREGGERIRYIEVSDDREEAQFVIREILELNREQRRPYGDAAILYRTNAQSRSFEEELLKYDIPYVVVGGVRFYARAEIKDVLAYLRLLVNPADDQGLRRVVNKPARGIGKTTIERGAAIAVEQGLSLYQGLRRYAEAGGAGRSGKKIVSFLETMDSLAAESRERPVYETIGKILDRSGYLDALAVEATPEAESRIDNLKELVASAEDFHVANRGVDQGELTELELFLDQVALVSDVDGYDQRTDCVSLMTTHSAKGLEFAVVFMVGMEEGIFPHSSSIRDPEGVEEERRLCYVGMTRAMERLTMTCASERRRFGERSYQSPSRFVAEVPEELMDVAGHGSGRRPSVDSQPDASHVDPGFDYSYSQESGEAAVQAGMRVRHPVFGAGTILTVIGDGLGQKLKIRFDRAGVKTVVVRYANLEPA